MTVVREGVSIKGAMSQRIAYRQRKRRCRQSIHSVIGSKKMIEEAKMRDDEECRQAYQDGYEIGYQEGLDAAQQHAIAKRWKTALILAGLKEEEIEKILNSLPAP
jgi:flagellar biosynthesis/type III secretory pathway protein FliH